MTKELHSSSIKPYNTWSEDAVPQIPQFGVLSKLNGTWVNWKGGPKGLHTTCMPSPGTSAETVFGVFHFKSQEYREQLKFTKVNAAVRNRAGSNEQFNGAVKYETAIIDNDDLLQHFENGMYIWLGDNTMPWKKDSPTQNPPTMFKHPSTEASFIEDAGDPVIGPGELGPQFVPPNSISRSGVIPHGTTIHLTGKITQSKEAKGIKNGRFEPSIASLWEQQYLSISPTMGINPESDLIAGSRKKPDWTDLPREKQDGGGVNSARAYFQRIFNYNQFGAKFPYTVQPNLILKDFNDTLTFQKYDLIELDSRHETGLQGGAINNVMIERYCRVARVRYRMWIEEVVIKDKNGTDKVIDQLQYEQIVDFEFMFGASGETTLWPHIQVNTLRRLEDISEEERYTAIELPLEKDDDVDSPPKRVVHHMKHTRD